MTPSRLTMCLALLVGQTVLGVNVCAGQTFLGTGGSRVVINRVTQTDETVSITADPQPLTRNFGSLPGNLGERNLAAEVPQPPHSLELWGWGPGWGSGWGVGPWWNYGNRWNIAPWGWGPRWGYSPFAFRYFVSRPALGYGGWGTPWGTGFGGGASSFVPLGLGVVSTPIVVEQETATFQFRPYPAGYRGCYYW